jgi:hypothetical protein
VGFRGNVDKLVIGVGGNTTTFDFELTEQGAVGMVPPDSVPKALFDSLGTVNTSKVTEGPFIRDIVVIAFKPHTPLAARRAAIDAVGGTVVGGSVDPVRQDGFYYVRISGGTFDALVQAVHTLQGLAQVGYAGWWPISSSSHRDLRHRTDLDRPTGAGRYGRHTTSAARERSRLQLSGEWHELRHSHVLAESNPARHAEAVAPNRRLPPDRAP